MTRMFFDDEVGIQAQAEFLVERFGAIDVRHGDDGYF